MKKILFSIIATILAFGSTVATAETFTDVSDSHDNYLAIEHLADTGTLVGYGDGVFEPEGSINRAELMKVLVLGQGIDPDEDEYKDCYPDVADEWFAPFVCYATEQGWVDGYPDGTFKPGDNVKKVEAVKMLINARGLGDELPESVDEELFGDTDNDAWYAPYLYVAKMKNLLEEGSGDFDPSDKMNRGGVAEQIFRTLVIEDLGIDEFDKDAGNEFLGIEEEEVVISLEPGAFVYNVPVDNFENMELADFPIAEEYYNWPKAAVWEGRLFYLSYPHVLEYSWSGELLGYTDLDEVECSTDMELIGDDLFVVCRDVGIYQIDLNTNEVTDFYDDSNGILTMVNPDLGHSGDVLWMGTFDGLAKIYPETGEVIFYDDELGVEGKLGTRVFARGSEVWITITANAYSTGYAMRYDYENDSWDAYGPEDFKTEDTTRIDFNNFIVSDEGVYVTFQDGGPSKVMLKKFNPDTDSWDEIYFDTYVEFNENFESYLPAPETYKAVVYEDWGYGQYVDAEIYDGDEWVTVDLDVYKFIDFVYDEVDKYYLLGSDGLYSFVETDSFPEKFATTDGIWSTSFAEIFIDDENKYVVYFLADMNEMMGTWTTLRIGVYDVEAGEFFSDFIELDEAQGIEYDDDWNLVFSVSQPEFDYENGMINLSVDGIGDLEIDIEGEIFRFQNN
jgi:S-layer homology domain